MRLFKFFTSADTPSNDVYLEEIFKFSDNNNTLMFYISYLSENISIDDALANSYGLQIVYLDESMAIAEFSGLLYTVDLSESVNINSWAYQPFYLGWSDAMQFNDSVAPSMVYSVSLNEAIGTVTSGSSGYKETGFRITWKTRTQFLNYGYGAAPYGDVVSYGDGTADDLASFKVEVYRAATSTLLRTETITIVDASIPDTYATYDYTYAYNIADNTNFEPNLTFKIYQIDILGRVSPCRILNIVPTILG